VQKTAPTKGADQEAAAAAQSVGSTRYDRPDLQTAYEAPENEIEAKVAEIWQELLAIDRIGRNDGFFELGGHSLLATQLVSRIRESFGVNVGLDGVFEAGSVAGLSLRVMERMLDGAAASNRC
jgi:acyl carrier protein